MLLGHSNPIMVVSLNLNESGDVVCQVRHGHTGIDVFVALLVRFVVPQFMALTSLYFLVFLTCVTLAGSDDKTRINYLALVDNQSFRRQMFVEVLEQTVVSTRLREVVAVFPYRAGIRNVIHRQQSEKLAETRPVCYPLFGLFIAYPVQSLKKHDLKDQYRVYRSGGLRCSFAHASANWIIRLFALHDARITRNVV